MASSSLRSHTSRTSLPSWLVHNTRHFDNGLSQSQCDGAEDEDEDGAGSSATTLRPQFSTCLGSLQTNSRPSSFGGPPSARQRCRRMRRSGPSSHQESLSSGCSRGCSERSPKRRLCQEPKNIARSLHNSCGGAEPRVAPQLATGREPRSASQPATAEATTAATSGGGSAAAASTSDGGQAVAAMANEGTATPPAAASAPVAMACIAIGL
mmetsp:Transcript_100949/g.324050  ORF Transcript_100949/g.324050 Transcript_100949/m.324050 type:complete len:210 (-) Transcript_100949:46-675(-)